MPLTTIFQVYLAAILMTPCRCIGGVNELEGLTQARDGQLISYLLLKIVSGLETDIQELKNQVADVQDLKSRLELKAEDEDVQGLKSRLELKADTGDVQALKAQFAELESRKRGM